MREFEQNFESSTPVLGTLASCENVIDRPQSHNHLVDTLPLSLAKDVLEVTLSKIDAQGADYLVTETECEQTLLSQCVETSDTDEIVYAHRKNRAGPTRFVLDREPEPTNHLVTVLLREKRRPGIMVLVAAIPGRKSEREPWDETLDNEESKKASHDFWKTHALLWEPDAIDFTREFWRET